MTYILAIVVSVLFLLADRVTKFVVATNMELFESAPFIPGFMEFRYIHNTGGAWGIMSDKTWVLVLLTSIVMFGCIAFLIRNGKKNPLIFWAICLVLSGGVGNMYDRIFNSGRVIDFLATQFIDFPIFNIADCAVCIGAGLLILHFILEIIREEREKKEQKLSPKDSQTDE